MEEGQTPQNGTIDKAKDDHPAMAAVVLPPPPGRPNHNNEMYIVQFPRDQIYRVPPRENTTIVERYRTSPKVNNKKSHGNNSCCSKRLFLTLAMIFVTIVAIIGITLATLYFIFNPKGPTFTVNDVVVKSTGKSKTPQYEIFLWVKNPNNRLGFDYESDAVVSLSFEGTKVAMGKFPTLEQVHDASSKVKVVLTGTNKALPKDMDKSMKDEKYKTPVSLSMDMELGVRAATAGFETWVMKSDVECKFKVNALRNDTRILSQSCDTDFKAMLKI
ncbi:hypothetical protein RIF29_42320 [Crotalaria pallida]|uniref:Late embryogenesis abundant protein LEA-2 subgroup domain-containing protein n=1 Tax=Crotalaria pallida TaxID=3830 RepID=A0AAN9E8X4_CROPI